MSTLHGQLIVFSGVDGAGKTTQIRLLESRLRKKGMEPVSFWARGGYTPLFSFCKSALRRIRPGALPRPGPSAERSRRLASPRTRRLWLTIAICDLILVYGLWLRIKRWGRKTIICDRYLEDTELDFQRNYPTETVARWRCWRFLRWIAPRPNQRFLLLVPPQESVRRCQQKNEPFPDNLETFAWRHARYQELAETGQWLVLDCMQPVEKVHEIIGEALES